jgi:hypothetical protein
MFRILLEQWRFIDSLVSQGILWRAWLQLTLAVVRLALEIWDELQPRKDRIWLKTTLGEKRTVTM